MTASVIAFTFAALAFVLMPGVDTILVLHTSIDDGSTAGIVTAAGIVCGPIVWGFLAAESQTPQADAGHTGNHFVRGLFCDLLNPKIGIFYLAIMPSLFTQNQISGWLGGLLGTIHAALGFVFLTIIAILAAAVRNHLAQPRASAVIQILCGLCLAGFGVYAVVDAVPSLLAIQ